MGTRLLTSRSIELGEYLNQYAGLLVAHSLIHNNIRASYQNALIVEAYATRMEEVATRAVEELEALLDVEQLKLRKTHDFGELLENFSVVFGHLDNQKVDHDVVSEARKAFLELRALVRADEMTEFHFVQELQEHQDALAEAVHHKEWSLVKRFRAKSRRDERSAARTTKKELADIASATKKLGSLLKNVDHELGARLHKISLAYANILAGLAVKERQLFK